MTAQNRPCVSIVIPCFNYGRFLRECLESVLAQDLVDTRVLIIDDASTDGSQEVAQRLARAVPNVELRIHERNLGHIRTYNEGLLGWADGDYVLLLSADDVITPGSLAGAVRLLEANPSLGMAYGYTEEFTGVPPLVRPTAPRRPAERVWARSAWLAKRCAEAVNVVPTPTAIVRREVQVAVGGYREEMPHAGDLDMWLRIALVSDLGFVGGHPQALYRVHPASMSQGVYRDQLADVRNRRAVFVRLFAEHGEQLRDIGVAPATTFRKLASEPLWWACRAYEKGEADEEVVASWVDFAGETYPRLDELAAYRALKRRRRLGGRLCHRTQLFVGTAAIHRAQRELWWHRWRRQGG